MVDSIIKATYKRKFHRLYAGYNHLQPLVDDGILPGDVIDWKDAIGLPYNARDSTLWLGELGAHTPCHYDTYGYNLHAQLKGEKFWLLWPNDAATSAQIQPTRRPYEESSVFSARDTLTSPPSEGLRCARVKEGEIIYIPRRWWHFVLCASTPCLSVNCWVSANEIRFG